MSEQPLAKRPREREDEGAEVPAVVEDEKIWMEDGNIVVSAGTNPVFMFKCHRSMLANVSDIFNDMLALPFSDAVETYKGVPMVHLQDSPDDIRGLLRMLYDVTYVFYFVLYYTSLATTQIFADLCRTTF